MSDKPKEHTFTEADIGETYWASEHSYEENVLMFGKPLADAIEYEKGKPIKGGHYEIVSTEGSTVTLSAIVGSKKNE